MIAEIFSNKKLNPIVTELFFVGRKLKVSLLFITQTGIAVPKTIRLNCAYYSNMKIPSKREFQKIPINHSSDNDFEDFVNCYKKCTTKPYSFLVSKKTLPSDNHLRFKSSFFRSNIKSIHDT